MDEKFALSYRSPLPQVANTGWSSPLRSMRRRLNVSTALVSLVFVCLGLGVVLPIPKMVGFIWVGIAIVYFVGVHLFQRLERQQESKLGVRFHRSIPPPPPFTLRVHEGTDPDKQYEFTIDSTRISLDEVAEVIRRAADELDQYALTALRIRARIVPSKKAEG